jgi:serine O-acetyltransferase
LYVFQPMFKHLNHELQSILNRDPAAKSKLEIFFCYPGFHALAFYRVSNWLWRRGLRFWPRWLSQFARFTTGIEIHPGATIGENFFIDHGMGVVIGETASIGNNVTIYHGVTLGGVSSKAEKRHPQIGDNVIIGSGAQLLGAINVGHGARIGSNAVVVKDVPAKATMVGVPARNVARADKPEEQFAAYGVSGEDLPDMVMKNFDELNKVIKQLTLRIAELEGGDETAGKWEQKRK